MIIAQSISSEKRSKQSIRSSVKPLAGPGATPSSRVSPSSRTRLHALPDGVARVADAVGVVQQQQVEALDAAALEAALGGHANVVGVVALGRAAAGR